MLHQLQMSSNINAILSEPHKENIAQNIYKIVSSNKTQDKIKIANDTYHKCCESSYWQDLLEMRLGIIHEKSMLAPLDHSNSLQMTKIRSLDRGLD